VTHKEYQGSRRNCKHYHKGDIVYWIRVCHDCKRIVQWGIVDDEFTDGVLVTTYVIKDYQTCDGVKITDMEFPTPWKQLPNGWTYETRLFELGCDLAPEQLDLGNRFIRGEFDADKEMIRGMITEGLLVPAYDTMHFDGGHIEAEIEKGRYRLVYRHNKWTHELSQRIRRWNELYDSYDEAQDVIEQELAEWRYVSSLSDYDYAVWNLEDRLWKWRTPNMTDEFIGEIKDWLLKLKPLEEYEFRGVCGGFQYKKIGNRKWLTVGISEGDV
jgi:hypothetical protein